MTSVLAFDTSQQYTSIAISDGKQIIDHSSIYMPSGHSDYLLPAMLEMLNKNHLSLKDIDILATIIGPGSFTGLRVSIAVAQGLGVALQKKIVGLTTFQAYAKCIQDKKNVMVIIDSQKQDVYCQVFSPEHRPLTKPVALAPEDLLKDTQQNDFILTGTASIKIASLFDKSGVTYDLQEISTDQICQNLSLIANKPEFVSQNTLHPFYLKEALVRKTL